MTRLKKFGGFLIFILLLATPGEGDGFGGVQSAFRHWHRVFEKLPDLERYLQEGKSPGGSVLQRLEGELEGLRAQEGANPFFPLAQGILREARRAETAPAAFAQASALAGEDIEVRILLWKAFLRLGQKAAAEQELKKIRGIRDQFGLHRLRYLSEDLSRTAKALAASRDILAADEAMALAEEFDPDAPGVHFARAQILFSRRSPQFLGALGRGWWLALTSPFYSPGYWIHLLSNLLLAVPLGLLLVGFILMLRTAPLLSHDLMEATKRRFPQDLQRVLPVALFLLPLILGLGLLPAILFSLLLLGVYLRGRERFFWGTLVISLIVLPWGYRLVATLITATTSPHFMTLLQVEEGDRGSGVEAALLRWAQEAPRDGLPRFYLGRLYRHRGELQKALAAYNEAIALTPLEAAIWTNRGNVAFLAGDVKEARVTYEKAISLNPDLPQPRFNLSQLLTEGLHLEQAQQEYAQAIRRMPLLKQRVQQAAAEGRKRVLLDAPLPAKEMWRRVLFLGAPSPQMAELLWRGRFLEVPLTSVPWLAGGYLVALLGIVWFRRRRRYARACERCGKVFCSLCQRLVGEVRFCSRCGLLEKARMEGPSPTIQIPPPDEEEKRTPRWLGQLLFLVPGLEGVWRGRTLSGFLLLGLTIVITSPLLGGVLNADIHLHGKSLPYEVSASLIFLVVLYLLTPWLSLLHRRRMGKEERWR